jgi:hypothetical protein
MSEGLHFLALLRAHVPCDVRIGVKGCMTVFDILVVFHKE